MTQLRKVWFRLYGSIDAMDSVKLPSVIFGQLEGGRASTRLTYEKALCEWFRNMSKQNVVRATAPVVELNYDWLNRFTRTRGSGLGHPD